MTIIPPEIKLKVFYTYLTLGSAKGMKGNEVELIEINE